jgi:two-component system, cell cycle response regulator DivK
MPKRRGPIDTLSVLIIDDDADARRMYSEYLRLKGWATFTAIDGRSGIDKATDLCPSAIVLDIAMPRVDGWTVLRQLRESSWTANIPVVIVSAVSDVRDEGFRAGCDAYLSKPCAPEIVWLQVRALFRLQHSAAVRQI